MTFPSILATMKVARHKNNFSGGSFVFLVRFVVLAAAIIPSQLLGAGDPEGKFQARQMREVASMVARGVLDPTSLFIVGEARLDTVFLAVVKERRKQVIDVAKTLQLTGVFPTSILRGVGLTQNLIWVQADANKIGLRERIIYHIPGFGMEGVWLYIVRPVNRLPQMLPGSTDIGKQVALSDKNEPPISLAKRLGLDSWLNQGSWYELSYEYSAFRVADRKIRDLPLPDSVGEVTRSQLNQFWKQTREVQGDLKTSNYEFRLSEKQLDQISMLVALFNGSNRFPTVDEILALDWEFGEAVLREVASAPIDKLSEGLRRIRDSLPRGALKEGSEGGGCSSSRPDGAGRLH